MGSLISGPKVPAPAMIAPPPAAAPATRASSQVATTANNARSKAAGAAGALASGQNPTGPQGLSTPPSTADSTLLGGTKKTPASY